MHSAPSVIYPVGRSSFLVRLLGAMWLAGSLACWLWWYEQSMSGWRAAVLLSALILAGLGAYRFWRNLPVGDLRWGGGQWSLRIHGVQAAVPATGPLNVVLDLQSHLLLRLDGLDSVDAKTWLWLDAAADRQRWHALRCAVYSRAMTDAQPDTGAVDP